MVMLMNTKVLSIALLLMSAVEAHGGDWDGLYVGYAATSSELFGLGVKATVGSYFNEDFTLGVIVDYAEHHKGYLANAGFRLSESIGLIGSVGILEDSEEFLFGGGREDVSQLEYSLSLKGNYDAGLLRGFEVNAYHTNANTNSYWLDTGDLNGLQAVAQLKPAESTDIRLGAGYEQVAWKGGEEDKGLTLQALGSYKLSDALSLNVNAKSAETEDIYGFGLAYDLSNPDVQRGYLLISFNEINGKHGIRDDTRLAVNWTIGFGTGAQGTTTSSMGRAGSRADVMTRPAFLPERVIARNATGYFHCGTFQPASILIIPHVC